jgi:hypothetical protein
MEINRNNYEEFFLMYVDGELSKADEKMVEIFIKENPDLEQELVLFQQSRLLSDPAIIYDHKETLMAQPAGSRIINLTNYEEFFLMYADNELPEEEKSAVEKFASQHPKLRKELSYILKCRIKADPQIVFQDKASLFRYEEPKKRILYFSRFNMGVAASLLLIVGFVLFTFVFNQHNTAPAGISHVNTPIKNTIPEKKSPVTVTPATVNPYNQSTAKLQQLPDRSFTENPQGSSLKKKQDRMATSAVEEPAADYVVERKSINVVPVPGNSEEPNTSDISSMIENSGKPVIALNHEQVQKSTEIEDENLHAGQQLAVVTMPNTEDGISVLTGTPGKSTMRGFFRKVSRVFEKTTRIGDEDEKKGVLIGNFQIALK